MTLSVEEPKFRHRAETLALARLLHYLTSSVPMPDLSGGSCVGSEFADNWHADMHRQLRARQAATYVCFRCPLQAACGEYALAAGNEELQGVWGGMWEQDRREIRAGTKQRPWLIAPVPVRGPRNPWSS